MKYYITQAGKEFIAETSERVKKAENEARDKVTARVAKARKAGENISPTQAGKRQGRAMHYAGRQAVKETP